MVNATYKEFTRTIDHSIQLYYDNQLATRSAENPIFHARTKHVELYYHFVREKTLQGEVNLKYVNTYNQVVDIFTKKFKSFQICEILRDVRNDYEKSQC